MDRKATTETGHKQMLSVSQLVELVRELKGTVVELRQSVADLKQTVRTQQQTIDELQIEKERLKQQLRECDGQHPAQRLDDEYSLEAEDKRAGGQRRKKQKSSRRGQRTTEEKLAEAHRHEDVLPEDVPPDDCTLHLSRVVWRVENGQAVLVAYHVYHGPGGFKRRRENVAPGGEWQSVGKRSAQMIIFESRFRVPEIPDNSDQAIGGGKGVHRHGTVERDSPSRSGRGAEQAKSV